MATVKPNSLMITELVDISAGKEGGGDRAHAGTAGVMLDFSAALGVFPS